MVEILERSRPRGRAGRRASSSALSLPGADRVRARRQRHRHARLLGPRPARRDPRAAAEPAGRARHRRRHLREPDPGARARRRRARDQALLACASSELAVADALDRSRAQRARAARAAADADARVARSRTRSRPATRTCIGHCERLAALAVAARRSGSRCPRTRSRPCGSARSSTTSARSGSPTGSCSSPGPLDDEERAEVERHPLLGDDLLAPLDLLGTSRPIVRHHHERWDGAGYPDGLAGPRISRGARIVAVADAVEVMASRARLPARRSARRSSSPSSGRGAGASGTRQLVDLALELLASGEIILADGGARVLEAEHAPEQTPIVSILLVEDDPEQALLVREAILGAIAGARIGHAARHPHRQQPLPRVVLVVRRRRPPAPRRQRARTARPDPGGDARAARRDDDRSELGEPGRRGFRRGAAEYVVKGAGYAEALAGRLRGLVEAG